MNTECVIPDWLHNIILGYGDPAAAHYTKYCVVTHCSSFSLDWCWFLMVDVVFVLHFLALTLCLGSVLPSSLWKALLNSKSSLFQTKPNSDWLVGWFVHSLVSWFDGLLLHWFIHWLIHWFVEPLRCLKYLNTWNKCFLWLDCLLLHNMLVLPRYFHEDVCLW